MRDIITGIFFGILISAIWWAGITSLTKPTCDEMQREFDTYRVCMTQKGNAAGCRMGIEQFIRYYDLEEELKSCRNP